MVTVVSPVLHVHKIHINASNFTELKCPLTRLMVASHSDSAEVIHSRLNEQEAREEFYVHYLDVHTVQFSPQVPRLKHVGLPALDLLLQPDWASARRCKRKFPRSHRSHQQSSCKQICQGVSSEFADKVSPPAHSQGHLPHKGHLEHWVKDLQIAKAKAIVKTVLSASLPRLVSSWQTVAGDGSRDGTGKAWQGSSSSGPVFFHKILEGIYLQFSRDLLMSPSDNGSGKLEGIDPSTSKS
ncbi:PREDICTED: uncharacterized protein LOC106537722 [Thamnophis sirtalis]|uniref:Uncharacterized protein LOC106537722 n=1 Tax=Thamnophis sirtalis TaxID=35019 RepID=A0A6I9WWU4_9SAUR|nr:PREDICTED: uncharacterized protein LOC106537722 [Thamnophis sirtalis]